MTIATVHFNKQQTTADGSKCNGHFIIYSKLEFESSFNFKTGKLVNILFTGS